MTALAAGASIAVGVVALIAGFVFFEGFIIMVVWGAIAGQFDGAPTIGFWLACAVGLALSLLGGIFGRTAR